MIVHVFEKPRQASLAAAQLFAAQILEKPDSVLGLATGSTPLDTYRQLIAWHKEGLLDFSRCVSFNLDEYVGLDAAHPASYHVFMRENLFDHVNFRRSHLPDGMARNLRAECRRYDRLIEAAGGIDLQFLGLGHNAHIAFNEPDSKFVIGTQVIDLTESTIEANKRFFKQASDVPRRALTLGAGGIMKARKLVLVAFGKGKARAVRAMVKGDADPQAQASILRMHPNCVVLLDEEAASLI